MDVAGYESVFRILETIVSHYAITGALKERIGHTMLESAHSRAFQCQDIIEVGPRDGFQAERTWIPTERKIDIITVLSRTGITEIQVTSFVHPKAVPQLADAEEVMTRIDRVPGVRYQALIPKIG